MLFAVFILPLGPPVCRCPKWLHAHWSVRLSAEGITRSLQVLAAKNRPRQLHYQQGEHE